MILEPSEIQELVKVATSIPGTFDYFSVRGDIFSDFDYGLRNKLPPKQDDMHAESMCVKDLTLLNQWEASPGSPHPLVLWLSALQRKLFNRDQCEVVERLREKAAVSHQRMGGLPDDVGLKVDFRLRLRDILESACIQQPDYREEILKAFMQSMPNSIPPALSGNEFFDRVAENVCTAVFPQDPTAHAAVRFAVLVYHHQKADIEQWLKRLCVLLRISDAERENLLACPACVQLEDRVVVIVNDRKPGYFVQAYRVFNTPNRRSAAGIPSRLIELPAVDPEVADEAEVFQRIGMLLQAAGLCPDTHVELCLPKKMLCCSLENIKLKKPSGKDLTVARKYPVVVRLWERHFEAKMVADDSYKAEWKTAWERFQADGQRQANRITPDFFECDDDEWVGIQLNELRGRGLVLTCCPHRPVGDITVLDTLIDAAVPVAVLPLREEDSMVELGDPASWRTSVLKCRQKQGGPALTLLWDDPESVPGRLSTQPRMTPPPKRVP